MRRAAIAGEAMRICFFGTFNVEEGYPRARVLIEGLRRRGHEVLECRAPFLANAESKLRGATRLRLALPLILRLAGIHLRLAWRFLQLPRPAVMVVGYPGQLDMPAARVLSLLRGVPLVFDAFLSLHDTLVSDRRLVHRGSWKARLLLALDKAACRLADLVLLDTEAHCRFFARRLGLPRRRLCRVFIGEDDRVFRPAAPPAAEARAADGEVLYFGTFVPLHGLPVILEAAKLLDADPACARRWRLTVAGRGQLSAWVASRYPRKSLPSVEWLDRWLPYRELAPLIERSVVVLGIFGTTPKAKRVIPLKVFAALAMGRAVVTGDTPAARELLVDGETALLVPPGDPRALSGALRRLFADPDLARRLGENARQLYRRRLAPQQLAGELIAELGRRGLVPEA